MDRPAGWEYGTNNFQNNFQDYCQYILSMSKSRQIPIVKPATRERGQARYFHGRVKILDNFKELLERAKRGNSGTSVLIQAAPGAGKTALLTECGQIAGERGYAVAEVEPSWFLDPEAPRESIRSSWQNWIAWLQQGAVNIDLGAFKTELVVGRGVRTPLEVIKKGKGPLLLLLDEAQRLARISHEKGERFMQVVDMLKVIHSGGTGRPVILIAAGLGATTQAFVDLDISRFDPGCRITLGMLKKEFTWAIIHDWLQKEGKVKGDPTKWVNEIAKETHGWPQHIMAYVWTALGQLKLSGGEMTDMGLEEGQRGRIKFYEARVEEFEEDELECIAGVLMDMPARRSIAKKDLTGPLKEAYGEAKAEQLFTLALHKGVLDKHENRYMVPIPSMYDWLVSNFGRNHG